MGLYGPVLKHGGIMMEQKALFGSQIHWKNVNLSNHLQFWPILYTDRLRDIFFNNDDEVNIEKRDISVESLRYFWEYQELLRQKLRDEFEVNQREILYIPPSRDDEPFYTEELNPYDRVVLKQNRKTVPVVNRETGKVESKELNTLKTYGYKYKIPEEDFLVHKVEFDTYTSYVHNYINVVNALHQLYTTCLHRNRVSLNDPNERIGYLFEVLHRASLFYDAIDDLEYSSARCLIPEDQCDAVSHCGNLRRTFKSHMNDDYQRIYFPLLSSFHAFQAASDTLFGGKYSPRPYSMSKPREMKTCYFWERVRLRNDALEDFRRFCRDRNDKHKDYLNDSKIIPLVKKCLEFIDLCIESKLGEVKIHYNSSDQIMTMNADTWQDALFLAMISDLQGSSRYATCCICQKEFYIESPKGQKYCPSCIDKKRTYELHVQRIQKQMEKEGVEVSVSEKS